MRKKGLEYAALGDLIKLAENFGLVAEETVVAADLARDFRNLIHPGKEKRKGAVSNRATARSALAAVDHVIEELSKKCAVWAMNCFRTCDDYRLGRLFIPRESDRWLS